MYAEYPRLSLENGQPTRTYSIFRTVDELALVKSIIDKKLDLGILKATKIIKGCFLF